MRIALLLTISQKACAHLSIARRLEEKDMRNEEGCLGHMPMCCNATQARMYTKLGIPAEGQIRRQARVNVSRVHFALTTPTGNTLSLLDRGMSGKNRTQAHEHRFLRTLNRRLFLLPIVREVHMRSGHLRQVA
ncbi:hypothetical protein [Paraburkholderia dipogonis]|uniref:hypothetical protein n=1 Tax=Paraburkholderia dipogonis TaxID=1211383 RepID=UPI0038BCF607